MKRILLLYSIFLFSKASISQNFNGSFKEKRAKRNVAFNIKSAPAPLFRDPVYDGAADPSLIWNPGSKEWIVFYTQRRASLELKNVAYCYGTAIGMATSGDHGKSWEYQGIVALPQIDTGENTFWAPQVFYNIADKQYHMLVTYIQGVHEDWEGQTHLLQYTSSDLIRWQLYGKEILSDGIDASVFQLKNGTWKMWYKNNKTSDTWSATSNDLRQWAFTKEAEISNRHHEAPVVFYWNNSYWMITDPTYESYTGLDVFRSNDGSSWVFNSTILNNPGIRPDDRDQGRHPDVKIINNKAYIFYFTHPGRIYPGKGNEDGDQHRWRYRRSSLQVAELEYDQGKIICNRNKYALIKYGIDIPIPE